MGQDGELLILYQEGREYWKRNPFKRKVLQNLNVGKEKTVYARFSIVPNVKGQKYTLGKIFTNREEQGEFIFLDGNTTPKGESSCCQIFVERDKFFICPVANGPGIFINGKKLSKTAKLNFGDRCLIKENNKSHDFVFMDREFKPEGISKSARNKAMDTGVNLAKGAKSTINTDQTSLGHNGLIVSQILSYLGVKHLKRVRLVSSLWNGEAFKLLRERSKTVFFFGLHQQDPDESMRLFRHSVEMGNTPMPHWQFHFPSFGQDQFEYDASPGTPGAKLMADLNRYLFQRKVFPLKTLDLGGIISSKYNFDFHLKVLEALGGPNLEELHWNVGKVMGLNSLSDYTLPANIDFSHLKTFTLSMTVLKSGGYSGTYKFLESWVSPVKNVSSLKLRVVAYYSKILLKRLNNVSESFANLNEILVQTVDPCVLKILFVLEMVQPLKKLELVGIRVVKKRDFTRLEQLLEKHSKSLELLRFTIFPGDFSSSFDSEEDESDENEEEEECPSILINLPTFPKLRDLIIGWAAEKVGEGKISLAFSGEPIINYGQHFPSLYSLTLWPVEFGQFRHVGWHRHRETKINTQQFWDRYGRLYEMFFPPLVENYLGPPQICRSLKILNIMTQLPKECQDKGPILQENKMTQIAAMFPNVHNSGWSAARKCPLPTDN